MHFKMYQRDYVITCMLKKTGDVYRNSFKTDDHAKQLIEDFINGVEFKKMILSKKSII